jgi:MFS family permease
VAEATHAGKESPDGVARWNFFANIADGAFFAFGLSFVSQTTILPVFVKEIGGGNVSVGLIPVIWIVGFNVPQLIVAGTVQRSRRKKILLLQTAMGQRLPWLLLALTVFFVFGRIPSGMALVLFFVVYGLAAVGGAVNLPVWFDLVVDLTPVRRRGRLFGARSILGSLLGMAGGAIAAAILTAVATPANFAILFLLAFLGMMCSYLFLVSLKVPETCPEEGQSPQLLSVAELVHILRSNPGLRNFLIADALQISAATAAAFYMVHAAQRFSLPPSAAGTFTMIMMGSMIVGSLVFGFLADRYGHRVNLLCAAAASGIASLCAIVIANPLLYSAVFVFSALTVALNMISRLPFIAELSPPATRPAVVAMANVVTAPCVFWGGISGVVADVAGFDIVFVIGSALAVGACICLAATVREPRHATHSCQSDTV